MSIETNLLSELDKERSWIRSLGWNSSDLLNFMPNEYQDFILNNLKPLSIVWKGRRLGSTSLLMAHMMYLRKSGSVQECLVIAPSISLLEHYQNVLKSFASPWLWPIILSATSSKLRSLDWSKVKHILFADLDLYAEDQTLQTNFTNNIESIIVECDISKEERVAPILDERMSEIYITANRCWVKSSGEQVTKELGRPTILDEFVRKLLLD